MYVFCLDYFPTLVQYTIQLATLAVTLHKWLDVWELKQSLHVQNIFLCIDGQLHEFTRLKRPSLHMAPHRIGHGIGSNLLHSLQ